jgi:hypothetical protein
MKVTIQNGSIHGVARAELEAIVPLFPEQWSRVIDYIVLYQSAEPTLRVSYHAKERIAGFHWSTSADVLPSKVEAVTELLVSLALISERVEMPRKVGKALRARLLAETSPLLVKCIERLAQNDA